MNGNVFKVEYLWLDGNSPAQLRSKTKIIECFDNELKLDDIPLWSFDGTSTNQATGESSDCVLKPVHMIRDPQRSGFSYLVLCEVFDIDGEIPHKTNHRAKLREILKANPNLEAWYGFEQEYTFMNMENNRPIGFPQEVNAFPKPQGDYYCGVGADNVKGRAIAEEHLDVCLDAGLKITGINAGVMVGQWEYQLLGTDLRGADELILSRYLLHRIAESYNVGVTLHPKPVMGAWNGSGCHINISTKDMREDGGFDIIEKVVEGFADYHTKFIDMYGEFNDLRLSGKFETSPINEFSWGYSDRGRSIRIPVQTRIDGKGYFEDRRPASNVDPYKAAGIIIDTIGKILKEN